MPTKKPFLTVFRKFDPVNVADHRSDPSKGISLHDDASFKPFWVEIHPRLTSVGEPEKKIGVTVHVFGQTFTDDQLA